MKGITIDASRDRRSQRNTIEDFQELFLALSPSERDALYFVMLHHIFSIGGASDDLRNFLKFNTSTVRWQKLKDFTHETFLYYDTPQALPS